MLWCDWLERTYSEDGDSSFGVWKQINACQSKQAESSEVCDSKKDNKQAGEFFLFSTSYFITISSYCSRSIPILYKSNTMMKKYSIAR